MTDPTLDAIARPSGGFAMVAMDQRESLRHMYYLAGRVRPTDDVLADFKMGVAIVLGPHASGFLIDRDYCLDRLRHDGVLNEETGLILAADALIQDPGGPVEDTEIDEAVFDGTVRLDDVVATKLLVIWKRDERRTARLEMTKRFVELSRAAGLLSVVEPVVRATDAELADGTWDLQAALVEAATELGALGASLYKAQVPLGGTGTPAEQLAASRELGVAIDGPWVVLSQGVERDRFVDAVTMACQAGASGFLAGRALWSDVVGLPDLHAHLRQRSVPRLTELADIVDRHATPWRQQ